MKRMRLDRFLSNSKVGSRKEVKTLIKEGLVEVNGITANRPDSIVYPQSDVIQVDGQKIEYREFHYIMLNKPAGVITATKDKHHNTVMDVLDDKFKSLDLFPVGRLDIDTEGLLILTNDGKLTHNILSPKKLVPKIYFAIIDGVLNKNDIELFKKGIPLSENYTTLPAKLDIIGPDRAYITIYEGKFHQIKRMFEYVNKKIIYLKRIQMGNLKLDETLSPGESRELTESEIELLKSSVD